MSSEPQHNHAEGEAHEETMTKGSILKVLGILVAITAVEFVIALILVPKGILAIHSANPIYIVLTLLKAFYIVAYFMHLKFEKPALIYAIAVPTLFIIGLILVLTNESHYWFQLRF